MAKSKNSKLKGRKSATQKGESSAQAARRATQLELPEGYQKLSPNNGGSSSSGHPRGNGKLSNESKNAQDSASSAGKLSPSYPKPWEMSKLYVILNSDPLPAPTLTVSQGAPIDKPGTLNFNYDRPWVSLEGKHVKYELATALEKGRREMLPAVFPDYMPEQKQEVRNQYERSGLLGLFEARDSCNKNAPKVPGFLGGVSFVLVSLFKNC